MSELLRSGRIGILDKKRNTNFYILKRWNDYGFLEGLSGDIRMKTALSYEIAANFLLMEEKEWDMVEKITGDYPDNYPDDESKIDTVIFPIIRRIVSKTPEASEYIPEIINTTKKYYNSILWRMVSSGDEGSLRRFYDDVLPKWCSFHRQRKNKYYDDLKMESYKKNIQNNSNVLVASYEAYKINIDWEAEFCAALAEKIENEIKEIIKIKENETD